jgi:acyl-CoA reductase-like NAD-dependent aldehyde dehydrogenase
MDGGWRATESTQRCVNNRWVAASAEESLDVIDPSGCGREKGFEALLGLTRSKTVAIRHG